MQSLRQSLLRFQTCQRLGFRPEAKPADYQREHVEGPQKISVKFEKRSRAGNTRIMIAPYVTLYSGLRSADRPLSMSSLTDHSMLGLIEFGNIRVFREQFFSVGSSFTFSFLQDCFIYDSFYQAQIFSSQIQSVAPMEATVTETASPSSCSS